MASNSNLIQKCNLVDKATKANQKDNQQKGWYQGGYSLLALTKNNVITKGF